MHLGQKIILVWLAVVFIQCTDFAQKSINNTFEEQHEKTPLPIQLEELSEAKRNIMLALQEADTSGYLIRARPILFQIQGVENNQNQHRNTTPFYKDVELMIYSLGEAKDSTLVDYGWIENALTGETVWKMSFDKSQYAGGDARNRKVVDRLHLPAGTYRLEYVSNESHANGDWQGAPPERPFYYGITAFNLWAIDRINELAKED